MRKRVLLAASILVLSLLVMLQGFLVLDANPVPWPSAPNFEKPTIIMETLQNNTVLAYNATDVWLNFTIAEPDSWIIPDLIPIPSVQVESAGAQLDGNNISLGWTNGGYVSLAWNRVGYSAKLNLNQTVPGLHTLNVTILLHSYYRGAAYNGTHFVAHDIMSSSGPIYQYPWTTSKIVYFTVEQPAPTQNANDSGSVYLLNQTKLILIAFLIVIVAVASISLVYFKRRNSHPLSQQIVP
jgi:hypothetical protein